MIKWFLEKKIHLKSYQFIWLYSLITLLLFSYPFLKKIINLQPHFVFVFVTTIVIFLYFNLTFNLFFYKRTNKIFAVLFLLINAGVLYFINTYNVFFDNEMLRNVIETDYKETLELLNVRFAVYMLFLGIIPSYLIITKIKIVYTKFWKEILYKLINIFVTIAVILIIFFSNYKTISSFARGNRHLQYLLIPTNYITSIINLGIKKTKAGKIPKERVQIITDAKIDDNFYKNIKRKNLFIIVVGEAARAQEFSLNGYKRNTNEPLLKQDLINFQNFHSCGTSTAISVPCIFSHFSRKDFNVYKEQGYENILDVLKRNGFDLLWRDNNSGCKDVCERIPTIEYHPSIGKNCNKEECFDEVMLENLDTDIQGLSSSNIVIILHQKGSHGPAYYKRIPNEKFKKYTPICNSELFSNCTNEEIVNSYDNTIYYTSYFLNKTIDFLKDKFANYNTAMFYFSDHGQSLGENGMYLHGAPYFIAPSTQTHIPAFIWLSDNFADDFKLNKKCLKNKANDKMSHDYVFHSLLGLFRIETKEYKKELDLFDGCKN